MSEAAEVADLPVEGGADNELDVTAPGADAGAVEPAESDSGVEDAGVDDDVFSFSDADAGDAQDGGEAADGGEGEDGGVFELSAETDIPQEFAEGLGEIARELGVPGGKGAQLIERAWEFAKAQQEAANKQLGAEMRKEWGREFDAKVAATKQFAARLAKRAGLDAAKMAPMMSPYGFKLLNAMREMVQEGGGFAGAANSEPKLTTEQQIDQIYETPELFRALTEPGDPRHDEINARLNRLMGIG